MNVDISYYSLILLITFLFLISVNFNLKKFVKKTKKLIYFFSKKDNNKNYTDKTEIINEYIPQDEIKNLIQEDLPFIKVEKNQAIGKIKFSLPSINLLRTPSQKKGIIPINMKITILNF